MNQQTATKLIEINHRFYQTVGEYFDSSRNYFWPGWTKLMPHLLDLFENFKLNDSRSWPAVLDLACGNGRFLEFLAKNFADQSFDYTGVDISEKLLEKAGQRLFEFRNNPKEIRELIKSDMIKRSFADQFKQKFDLIVVFGMMHHIPGEQNRLEFLQNIYDLLTPNGRAVITFWKFLDIERLRRRVVDKVSEGHVYAELQIDQTQLDPNDYVLDWNRGLRAYRYCHYYPTDEIKQMFDKIGFEILDTYKADAKEDVVNEYFVVSRS